MSYDVPAIIALAKACAPEIATEAIVPLVLTESGGEPLQINVNKGPRVRARTVPEGAALVRRYIAAGYTVDVGLAQINSANFTRLGVTIESVFEPCNNLRLASVILQRSYDTAARHYSGLDAISATYSMYNTGSLTRGLRNGYAGRVWSAAVNLGSIETAPALPGVDTAAATRAASAAHPTLTAQDQWVVGPLSPTTVMVFK